MSSVSILSLPLHVLQSILCRLENADSLMAAVCSHSLFYAAFKEHQESIAEVVSSREVSSTLYPFALAAFSIQSKPFDVDFLTNVLYDLQYRVLNFPSRGSINFKCQSSLRSASYISKLHKSVCYFTHHLGGEAMDRALIDLYLTRDLRELPSDAEAFLIQRAFYRFQILCEIVTACSKARGADDSLPQGVFTKVFVADILLGPFPPWVNEQLACAYDLLEEALFQKFCRVAKQDIEWGARHVSYASTPDDRPYIRGLLTYGLLHLHRVHTATQYDEIREVLVSKPLAYSDHGLDDCLTHAWNWREFGLDSFVAVGDLSRDELWNLAKRQYLRVWGRYCERMDAEFPLDEEFQRKSSLSGQLDNPGLRIHEIDSISRYPFQVWYQAHEETNVEDCNYKGSLCFLRLCGYVFWDEPEEEFDTLTMEEQIEHLQNISGFRASELHHLGSKEAQSWEARTEIYKKGGRGYWSEDGVHRIEWTGELVDEVGIAQLRHDFINVTIPKEPKEPKRRRNRPAITT